MNIINKLFPYKKELVNNLPYILYINLDKSYERNIYMKNLFKEYKIVNYHRIKAYDSKYEKPYIESNLKNSIGDKFTKEEYGCVCSHLKAIEYFYNEMDENEIIILEDDISFELCRYFKKDFKSYLDEIPKDYDICLLYNSLGDTRLTNYKKDINQGTIAYLISRKGALKIINRTLKENGKYNFTNKNPCADIYLYQLLDKVFVHSLIIPRLQNDSTIHENHLTDHERLSNKIIKNWKEYYLLS